MISSNGFDNVLWYVGAVDKNDDAIKQGRVRVRAYGIHSPDRNLVPTEDLPWAPVLNLGYGVNTPAPGDWVFGCFIDGRDAQHPIVLGIIPGQNLELPGGTGSSDDYLSIEALRQYGIPPLGKIMAGEDLETTQLVLQNAAKMIFGSAQTAKQIAGQDDNTPSAPSIEEPGVPAATEPHKNMVWKSRNSNSYIQIAEDEEFIVISHESGSHMQIDSSGNIKIKSFGDSHYYSEGHMMEATAGSRTVHIEGAYALECKNVTLQVNGDMNHTVKGDYNLNVGGKMSITAGESFEMGAQRMSLAATSEHFNLKSAQKIKIDAGNNLSLKSGSDMFLTSDGILSGYSTGNMFLNTQSELHKNSGSRTYNSAGGNLYLTSGGIIAGDGSEVYLNSGLSTTATAGSKTPESTKAPEIDTPVEREVTNISSEVESTTSQIGAFDSDESVEV